MPDIDEIFEQWWIENYPNTYDYYWSNLTEELKIVDASDEIIETISPAELQNKFKVNYIVLRNYLVNRLEKVEY